MWCACQSPRELRSGVSAFALLFRLRSYKWFDHSKWLNRFCGRTFERVLDVRCSTNWADVAGGGLVTVGVSVVTAPGCEMGVPPFPLLPPPPLVLLPPPPHACTSMTLRQRTSSAARRYNDPWALES